jgi:hypothetical protein
MLARNEVYQSILKLLSMRRQEIYVMHEREKAELNIRPLIGSVVGRPELSQTSKFPLCNLIRCTHPAKSTCHTPN